MRGFAPTARLGCSATPLNWLGASAKVRLSSFRTPRLKGYRAICGSKPFYLCELAGGYCGAQIIPGRSPCEHQVCTIHDLIPLEHPEWFTPQFVRMNKILPHASRS